MLGVVEHSRRILLVENLERMGHLIALCLIDCGYEVAKVGSPEEVSERLAEQDHDLVVFNTGLPAEQKSAFIRRWREEKPAVKVLEIPTSPTSGSLCPWVKSGPPTVTYASPSISKNSVKPLRIAFAGTPPPRCVGQPTR
jgi:CheY-like chemotaxis protein